MATAKAVWWEDAQGLQGEQSEQEGKKKSKLWDQRNNRGCRRTV